MALYQIFLIRTWTDETYVFPPLFLCCYSVMKSCPTLQPHELQHARLPCPSPSPGVWSNLCPLSRWCHPTISSSVVPFSSCLQSFPASGSFSVSLFFASGGQSTGVWASALVLPMNIQDWFPLGLDWFDLTAVQGTLKSFLTSQFKSISSSVLSFLYGPTLTSIHDYRKTHSFDYIDLCRQSNVSAF